MMMQICNFGVRAATGSGPHEQARSGAIVGAPRDFSRFSGRPASIGGRILQPFRGWVLVMAMLFIAFSYAPSALQRRQGRGNCT
jgi:hypothetical protein